MPKDSNYIREKYSKKHHYLPVFYLKGFTDSDELFYIYDKQKDTILSKQKPESKFFEKHLNNYKFNGEVKLTLEEPVFSPMDSKAAALFTKIRNRHFDTDEELTSLEKFEVLQFIERLFWRSTESDNLFVEIIKKEGLSNKYFGFARKGQEEYIPDEEIKNIKEQILSDKEIQKLFKHIIPLSNGIQEEIYKLYDKWQIYTLNAKTPNFITGDQPFLINNDDISLDNILNESIFPIGKHKLLTLSDKSPNFIDAIFMTQVNLSILHQAKRFIACDNEEQIKQLVTYYNKLAQLNLDKRIVKDTFGLMHHQSTFKNHEEYYKAYLESI